MGRQKVIKMPKQVMVNVTQRALSPNFNSRETKCHCGCGEWKVSPTLVQSLELLRKKAGNLPIYINSARRCAVHNANVGGAADSQHLNGKAADITHSKLSLLELLKIVETVATFKNGGIGVYETFLHVDVRQGEARWGKLNGKFVTFEEAVKWHEDKLLASSSNAEVSITPPSSKPTVVIPKPAIAVVKK